MIAQIFASLATLVLAIFTSYAMLLGSGFFPQPDWAAIGIFSLFILLLSGDKKAFFAILLPLSLLYAFYTPVGMLFGPPSYQYVASVFATDLQEGKEFLSQIPLQNFALAVGIIAAMLTIRWLVQKFSLTWLQNRGLQAVSFLAIFAFTPPAKFLLEGSDSLLKVRAELARLNGMAIESQWGMSTLSANSRYDDYVLIIGESARKDYHHAYGYPIENTPFMSRTNGTLINGLTAAGTNTIASLKLMLTQPDTAKWEGNYALNLIDLIKSAGIRTYWISNQGYLGTFDTPISSIANKSDEKFFTKSGDSFNQNVSDFALLPKFDKVLQQPASGKRFIVLHLYGSHPLSCDRLTDYPKLFKDEDLSPKHHNLNCYVSSIKKTDEMLEKVYQALRHNQQSTGRSFSMVYFSDHGLSHQVSENSIDLLNTSKSKLHFDVPLFKISSDDTQRNVHNAMKSGLNFTNGIANWIGIQNPKLNREIDLFSPQNDPSDYGLKAIIDKIELPADPAVVIEPKK